MRCAKILDHQLFWPIPISFIVNNRLWYFCNYLNRKTLQRISSPPTRKCEQLITEEIHESVYIFGK